MQKHSFEDEKEAILTACKSANVDRTLHFSTFIAKLSILCKICFRTTGLVARSNCPWMLVYGLWPQPGAS